MRNLLLISILFFVAFLSNAQNSFSFLNMPTHARINALGGINVSVSGQDLNFITSNPALLDSSQRRQIGLSYSPYLAHSNYLTLNYVPQIRSKGTWAFSLQNLHYGTFQGTDAVGNLTNDFSANDFVLASVYARKVKYITLGVSAKLVGSVLESYSSIALVTDLGATFRHPIHDFSIGLAAKNIGYVLKSYGTIRPDIPFDLQLGTTFKPKYMPVRFSLTGHHLYVYDIAFNNIESNFIFDEKGNKIQKKISTADNISRHFVLGSELLIHKNFNLLFGYNFLRRKELLINGLGGAFGFSFGASLSIKKIDFCISHAILTTAKGQTTFSLIWRK
jgi:hypothetical protein